MLLWEVEGQHPDLPGPHRGAACGGPITTPQIQVLGARQEGSGSDKAGGPPQPAPRRDSGGGGIKRRHRGPAVSVQSAPPTPLSYSPSVSQFLHQVNEQARGPLPRQGAASSSERELLLTASPQRMMTGCPRSPAPGSVGGETGVWEPRVSCPPVLSFQACPPGGQTCASQGQRGPEASCWRCPLQSPHPWGTGPCGGGCVRWLPGVAIMTDFKSARTWRICGFTGLCGGGGLVRQLGGPSWVGWQLWVNSVPGPEWAPRLAPADRVGRRQEACTTGPLSARQLSRSQSPQPVPPPCPVGIPGARPSPVCWSLPQRAAFFKSLLRAWK